MKILHFTLRVTLYIPLIVVYQISSPSYKITKFKIRKKKITLHIKNGK